LKSRASVTPRYSSEVDIPEETPDNQLRTLLITVFSDVQKTTASHRKLVISLRKIQERCCYESTEKSGQGKYDQFDEVLFNQEFERCIIRVCAVKRSEPVGDRVIRFMGLFLKHAAEKDTELIPPESQDDEMFMETPTSRLISSVLSMLLPLMTAKEKITRYRATQMVSYIVNSVDAIDDDIFQQLRQALIKRIRDKESMVRVQAVLGLGRLAGEEEELEDEDEEVLLDQLLDVLQNDPSADVRRSLLLNLPITPGTLPFLLERARDLDAATRRALYSRLLPALGDFRHLSLSMREKILRWGLRDRDENVRKAAGKLFRERWIEDCNTTREETVEEVAAAANKAASTEALLELLERIDVVNSGSETGIAAVAMRGFWEGRPDYREAVTFDDDFWNALSAESVFLARSFNDFCREAEDSKHEALLEKMPEVTKLGFYLQKYVNALIAAIKKAEEEHGEMAEEDEEIIELEFIVEQLLRIALTLDYSDEVGRRKMFSLIRETLAIAQLPDEVTVLVVELLRSLTGTEASNDREFCGLVLEAIAEVHDTIASQDEPDESFHSAVSDVTTMMLFHKQPAKSTLEDDLAATQPKSAEEDERDAEKKAILEIMINMKCLHIAQCMLANVSSNLKDNVHLVTMLNNLVIPAVRSHEAPIRERGLRCLGLCCLLDKTLAEENLTLFIHCFNRGHDALQVEAVQVITDMLTVHGNSLLSTEEGNPAAADAKTVHKLYLKALKLTERPEVQAASAEALSKLFLTGVITDEEEILKSMILTYFDPLSADNPALRQTLNYFLSVFAHSKAAHQELLGKVVMSVMHAFLTLYDNRDLDDEEEIGSTVTPSTVLGFLLDWTDPRKVVDLGTSSEAQWDENGRKEVVKVVGSDIQTRLAESILERCLAASTNSKFPCFLIP
jgi:condensin complex subunit 3